MAERTRDALNRHDYELDEIREAIDDIRDILSDLIIAFSDMARPTPDVEPEPGEAITVFKDPVTGAYISDPAVASHDAYIERTYGRDDGSAAIEARREGLPEGYMRDPFGQIRRELGGGKLGPIVQLDADGYEITPSDTVSPNMVRFDDSDSAHRRGVIAERRALGFGKVEND